MPYQGCALTPGRRRAALLAVFTVMIAGCSTSVRGTAVPAPPDAGQTSAAEPPGMVLRQQPGIGPAKTFGGTPIFDACTVLPFDVVRASGIDLDTSEGPGPFMKTAHMTADGQDDRNSRGSVADAGISRCEYPGSHGEALTFTIYQTPFDSPNSREEHEKSLRQGGREGQAAGFRTLSATTTELHTWTTGIFADNFYAILHLNARDPAQPENPRLVRLVENAAERLHAAPTGPATYSYDGEFAHVPPPCEVFTSTDFQQAIGSSTDGRTVEQYDLAKKHITADAMSGTTGHTEHFYVTTGCTQENQAAANSGVGPTPAQSITVTMESYLTSQMAAEANDYDCAIGKGYRHPAGEPKPVPFTSGDGLTCLINMGSGRQSPLAFKSGRSTVELNVFYARNLKDDATAIRVYSGIANAVAARLADR
ncbi:MULTISPECIES: hypothetical protein [Amycolatopsis]|uniref:DUF3558 domain-containing protein n=1 Tax=Amycolatopsis bullii TaxID=941987 RepID=A0ABQ3KK37_9PSEU|nr:hypothetical protein [Amycolatopsis bullii]GHG32059.1 hypothetical protein GCM10017567_60270 [Amycolatopsis bullii]